MELFYSQTEKILFYIAGYTDNSENVEKIIETLNEGADKLVAICYEDKENVNTFLVTKSRQYKGMRIFYVETANVPDNTFRLSPDWTMIKWVEA